MNTASYVSRLRSIVLHSGDAAPEEVADYLRAVAKHGSWEVKKEVLGSHNPLAGHLPKEYVDFALAFLLEPAKQPRRPGDRFTSSSRLRDGCSRLGFRNDRFLFFHPSHLQGPFLFLLRANEGEGLRLVHTLANTAVARWKQCVQGGRWRFPKPMTPLPVVVELPSGPREFWGNAQVYCWFRPVGDAPNALTSALMALEFWMEEQVEAGRDAQELFATVLAGSECLAVPGACLSVALAYPDRCLKAALPLVCCAALWDMDIQRTAHDQSRYNSNFAQMIDPTNPTLGFQVERDKQPQRRRELRFLAMGCELSDDPSLRQPFERATRQFTEKLPILFEEWKSNSEAVDGLREQMERYAIYGDRANYKVAKYDDERVLYSVESPAHIMERDTAERDRIAYHAHISGLYVWAVKTLDGETVMDMTVEQALTAARELYRPDDFQSASASDESSWEKERRESVAGTAAAALAAHFESVRDQGHLPWCRDILFAAADAPLDQSSPMRRGYLSLHDPKVAAGRGLGALVANGVADEPVKQRILRLASLPYKQSVAAVFRGLQNAWCVDEKLCWNALNVCLTLCLRRHTPWNGEGNQAREQAEQEQHIERVLNAHQENLSQGRLPNLPQTPNERDLYFDYEPAENALAVLPLSVIAATPEGKQRLLTLADDFMAWTVRENTPPDGDPYNRSDHTPMEWNHFFLDWLACLSQSLEVEEVRQHVLSPVGSIWRVAPELTTDLMRGLIRARLGSIEPPAEDAVTIWNEICDWVLDSPELAQPGARLYRAHQILPTAALAIFVSHGACSFTNRWPHLIHFANIVERWIGVVGHDPDMFSHLLTILKEVGGPALPNPALCWLGKCAATSSENVSQFWSKHDNGARTAELLRRVWISSKPQVHGDAETLRLYSGLVDALVVAGISLAATLQSDLEKGT